MSQTTNSTTAPLTHGIVVKAHIIREGHVLLLKRQETDSEYGGHWDIPGGRLHLGEGAAKGLAREVHEETALTFTRAKPLTVWDYRTPDAGLMQGLSFLIKDAVGDVQLSQEHTRFEWLGADALDSLPLAPNLRKEIEWILGKENLV